MGYCDAVFVKSLNVGDIVWHGEKSYVRITAITRATDTLLRCVTPGGEVFEWAVAPDDFLEVAPMSDVEFAALV